MNYRNTFSDLLERVLLQVNRGTLSKPDARSMVAIYYSKARNTDSEIENLYIDFIVEMNK